MIVSDAFVAAAISMRSSGSAVVFTAGAPIPSELSAVLSVIEVVVLSAIVEWNRNAVPPAWVR